MKKRILFSCVLVLVLVLALFAFTACNVADTEYGQELVTNGDFEEYTDGEKGLSFNSWKVRQDWDTTNSAYGRKPLTRTESEDSALTAQLGESYVYLKNTNSTYSYLYQEIKVDRKEIYKVVVDVRIDEDDEIKKGNDTDYKGAHVTFLENVDYILAEQKTTSDDNGGWKTLTYYVKPIDTDYLTVCLKLGAEGAASSGTAYFDNVSLVKVEEAPEGANVIDFRKAEIVRYNTNVGGILFVVLLALFTVAVIAIAYVLIRRLYSRPTAFLNFSQINGGATKSGAVSGLGSAVASNPWFIASALAIGTFLLNLIFLLTMYGFGSEMNYTVNLAKILAEKNAIRTVYANFEVASTASPGALYILSIIGMMGKNLNYDGISILIRMVNVLGSMATVVMIYLYGRKYVGDRQSTIYAALYALLPITLVMSGLDNTFTALLVSLLVASMLLLVEKKHLATYLVFALAVLLDVRALALLPLIITYLGYRYYKDDENLKKFTKNRAELIFGLLGFVVLLYVLTIPVALDYIKAEDSKPFYGWTLIANEIIKNNIFVDNALGLYGMVAMNMKSTTGQTAGVLNIVFLLVLEMYVISLYVKNRNKQELIMLASFTLAITAVFTLKMDYTYIFLALALGFIYTMVSGEKRMYGVLGAYSLLAFLNIGQIMNNSNFVQPTSYFEQAVATEMYFVNFETTSPDFIIFCVLAVLTTLYYGYVSYSISNNGKLVDIPAMSKPFAVTAKNWFENFGGNVKNFFAPKSKEE